MSIVPHELLPLKPLVFDVLLVLNERERHGYGIVKQLSALGDKRILPGNFYRTLSSMAERGLIEAAPRKNDDEDERRRFFRITRFGREVASAEAARLRDRVAMAREQKLLSGAKAR